MTNRRGQVLVETCATLLLQLFCSGTLLLCGFWIFAIMFLNIEAFSLARSSLYGVRRTCAPSKYWPKFRELSIHYSCLEAGVVTAHLALSDRIRYEKSISLRGTP